MKIPYTEEEKQKKSRNISFRSIQIKEKGLKRCENNNNKTTTRKWRTPLSRAEAFQGKSAQWATVMK